MQIQVLGPVRVWRDGAPVELGPAGQRATFALLAIAGGQPVRRGELAGALWGGHPPPSAINIIQTHVKRLRRALEPERRSYARSALLPTVGQGYALAVTTDQVDLGRFRALAGAGELALAQGDARRAAGLLGRALALWQGPPLADLPALAECPKTVALSARRREVRLRYAQALLATGAGGAALPSLEDAVAEQPLDEAACACLIEAYRRSGQRARAFATYHEIRRRLAEELGVDPGPHLHRAHAELLYEAATPPRRLPAGGWVGGSLPGRGRSRSGARRAVRGWHTTVRVRRAGPLRKRPVGRPGVAAQTTPAADPS